MAVTRRKHPLPQGLVTVLRTRPTSTDSGELLASLIKHWGGVENLAMDIRQCFSKSSSSPLAQQRILNMIQALIVKNTENEKRNVHSASELSTEDLQAYAEKMFAKFAAKAEEERESQDAAETKESPSVEHVGTEEGGEDWSEEGSGGQTGHE